MFFMNKKQRLIDSKLVVKYQSGDAKALPLLVERWHKTFCQKAYWIIKDSDVAKDIAQDSWSSIIDKINHLKNPESFGGWALRIVYIKSIDWLNSSSRQRSKLEAYKQEQDIVDIEKTDTNSLNELLLISLKNLPEHQRVVIKLFYIEEHSLKEIGDILDISIGTVKSRLFHAREKLKQKLKTYNYEKV